MYNNNLNLSYFTVGHMWWLFTNISISRTKSNDMSKTRRPIKQSSPLSLRQVLTRIAPLRPRPGHVLVLQHHSLLSLKHTYLLKQINFSEKCYVLNLFINRFLSDLTVIQLFFFILLVFLSVSARINQKSKKIILNEPWHSFLSTNEGSKYRGLIAKLLF